MTKYINYVDKDVGIDCIFKYIQNINKYSEDVYNINSELHVVLIKEGDEYKKVYGTTTGILYLKSDFDKNVERVTVYGGTGRNFMIDKVRDINFRGKGLFSYFMSLLLNETFEILEDLENHYIYFPDSSLKFLSGFEKDKGNYLRRNRAYEKLGFNLEFKDAEKKEGQLLNTPVENITLQLDVPSCLNYYTNAYELILDAVNLVPFANEVIKKDSIPSKNSFAIKETIIKNASYDVQKVIGTDHPNYKGLTWINALKNLKRSSNVKNLSLDYKKEYGSIKYYNDRKEFKPSDDPWSIYEYDEGDGYISEGNHRTIISKFLNALELIDNNMKGLKQVKKYEIDIKTMKEFNGIKRWLRIYYPNLRLDIKVVSNKIDEVVNGDTTVIKYKLKFHELLPGKLLEIQEDGSQKEIFRRNSFENIDILKAYLREITKEESKEIEFKISKIDKKIRKKLAFITPYVNSFKSKFVDV